MKKILSLLMVGAMMVSMIPAAYATNVYENPDADTEMGTNVSFDSADNEGVGDSNNDGSPDNVEYYTVTVPALLAPEDSGNVTAAGTWNSARKLVVTADKTVRLTNSINSADYKDLDITFPNIELVGSNTAPVSDTKVVSVAEMPADALFGTWSGTFNYTVTMSDVA